MISKVYILLLVVLVSVSCKYNNSKNNTFVTGKSQLDSLNNSGFPSLTEGETLLAESDFGEIIELIGESHPVDHFFKVSETEMIANDTLLVVKNLSNDNLFMAYSLPDFKFIKSFGNQGKGPGEFQFVSLVKSASKSPFSYIFENTQNKLFSLSSNLQINELPWQLPKTKGLFEDKQLQNLNDSSFVLVTSTGTGKAIYEMQKQKDSITNIMLYDLAFSKKYRTWAAYTGDFGANPEKERLVYAYKYFKRLMFIDTKSGRKRILNFKAKDTQSKDAIGMLSPENITHYWGISAQKNYVYLLYSGRSPIDVSAELKNTSGYIYIEQYDWNGNPVKKYKLDRWGYFCLDETEKTIYIVSTKDEHPFYSYKIPQI